MTACAIRVPSYVRKMLGLILTLTALSMPTVAQDENESVGFRSTHVFESGSFGENLDTLNGGLTLTMPIGPRFKVSSGLDYGLTLNYSSKVWDATYYRNDIVGEAINEVIPTRKGPFGIGFSMHLGRIYRTRQLQAQPTVENYSPPFTSSWIWESPDGTPHEFFSDPNINPDEAIHPPAHGPGVVIPPGGASGTATPTFTNRATSDMSYALISGPATEYCRPNGDNGTSDETGCFRVQTPDGLIYTLAKRVECVVPPLVADPDFRLDYQQIRSDNESYCGWYTTLIEDPGGGSSPYPNHVRVAYDERPNFEHLMSRVYDSTWVSQQQTGRRITFHNCEWQSGANPSGGDIVEMCRPGTRSELDANPSGATSRLAAATYMVDMPAPGNSTSFNSNARARYSFYYEFSTVKLANYYHETNPLPDCGTVQCTPAVTDPVMKLVRVDYPPALRAGQSLPDEYSVYYGYFNSYSDTALALAFGGNGDYGEVTCRTLPLLRRKGGESPRVVGNACSGPRTGEWALFHYEFGYYFHIDAYLSSGPSAPSAYGEQHEGPGGGLAFRETSQTRHVVVKSLEHPAGTTATRPWTYRREVTGYSNPFTVTVTDPFRNDTVYHYFASAPSSAANVTGADPEDGFAPEWSDGLNHRTEYFRGTGSNRILVRSEVQEHDADIFVPATGGTMRSKSNIRSKKSVTVYHDDGNVESLVTRQQWDGFGHWQVEIESGFDVPAPRMTRTIRKVPQSVYRTDSLVLKEVSDGRRVLSRLEQEYDARGKLIASVSRMTPPASIGTPLPGGSLAVSARPGDVLTVYTYGASSGNITGKVMSTGRSEDPTYRIAYGWAPAAGTCATVGECGGYLATKTFMRSEFTPGPFLSIDRDRDANTGLIIATRDTARVQTNYLYDVLGRLRSLTPADEEETVVDYVSLQETTTTQGTRTTDLDPGADFVFARYRYDGLGRLIVTEKRPSDPTRGYVCEKSQYDVANHLLYKTEAIYATSCGALPAPPQGQCWAELDAPTRTANPGTEADYRPRGTTECDPFGRVQREIPADADPATLRNVIDTHHFGTSTEVTVHGIRGPLGLANDATVVSLRDALNRLIAVDTVKGGHCVTDLGGETGRPCSASFPCGGGESCVTSTADTADAFYEYDAADRLVLVRLTDNLSQHQMRRFGYDGLGRVLWQENPEDGTTVFKRYDALGNPLEIQVANGNARRMAYDFAGRVVRVGYGRFGGSIRDTTSYSYDVNDATTPFGLGKVHSVNSLELTSGSQLRQVLTQFHLYNGRGGRLSTLKHEFADWAANLSVATDYTYTSRGQVATITYPRMTPTPEHEPLMVTYGYRNGAVVCASRGDCSPTDGAWLGKVQYNAAGGVEIVDMPGGGRTQIATSPLDRNRPVSITGGTTGNWAQAPYRDGPYKYDAAGNIYEIGHATGADRFAYDTASRLVGAHTEYAGSVIDETYSYDVFGNMTRHVLNTLGGATEIDDFSFTAPVTNRVMSSTSTFASTVSPAVPFVYDANGNLREAGRRINPGSVVEDVKKFDYDVMDRLVKVHKVSNPNTGLGLTEVDRFAYDAAGHRVVRKVKDVLTTFSVRDSGGQVLTEFRIPSSYGFETPREWAADYVYLAGRLLTLRENTRPHTPTGLTASQLKTPSGCTSACKWIVTINWTANSDADIASYKVYRQIGETGGFTLVGPAPSVSLPDPTQHNPGVTLEYQVTAVDQQGNESLPSMSIRLLTGDVAGPTAPTTLTATGLDRSVWLSWTDGTDSSGIIGFEICRHETTASPCVPLNDSLILTTTFHDLNLVNGRTYYYKVRARDANLTWGAYSCRTQNACDTPATPTDRTPPAPPKGIIAASTCGSAPTPETIDVSWEPNAAVPPYTISYEVFRAATPLFEGLGAAPTSLGSTTSTTFRDPGPLTPGTNYYYAVKAKHLTGGGEQVVTTSPFSPIVTAMTRDTTITPQGRLIAVARDGEVNLLWQPPSGAPTGTSYKIYRKANAESGCSSYVQVAQGSLFEVTDIAGVTDSGVPNNIAYDYTLVQVAANGTESSFGATTLAVPLDRPRGFSQCRGDGLRINWSPPDARFYQPYLATTADGTLGYLKGYHLYHHKRCGFTYPYLGYQVLIDDSPTRPILVNEGDPIDPYLIDKDLGPADDDDDLFDPRYFLRSDTEFSTPEGTRTELAYWQGCGSGVGGVPVPDNCAMPRAVYKIFAEGTWITRESEWPDYFDHDNPDPLLRCGKTLVDPGFMLPSNTAPTISRDGGAEIGFALSEGKTITYWIEERIKSDTGVILERNTTTHTVTLIGDGTVDRPRITRPSLRNVEATHWALYATATNGLFPDGAEIGEVPRAAQYIDDRRIFPDPGMPDGYPYAWFPIVPYCKEIGTSRSAYSRPVRKVEATAIGPGSIRLDWVPPIVAPDEPRIAGYYVYGRHYYGISKRTFKSPLPFATLGPSETSLTISGMIGVGPLTPDVFTVKTFDEAGRVSSDLYRCSQSGEPCTEIEACTAKYCSNSKRPCNGPADCAAGYCRYSNAACTSDSQCSEYACSNNGLACSPVGRLRKQAVTAATGGATSITATLTYLPILDNHLVLAIGVRSTSTTTPVGSVSGGGVNEWVNGARQRQADGVWVEIWYGQVNGNPITQTVTVSFQTGTSPKASVVVAEYSGLPSGNIGVGVDTNSASNTATASVGTPVVVSPYRLSIVGFANVGISTYSGATNGYTEVVGDIASTGGSSSSRNNTVMLEKWVKVDPQQADVTATLSAPSSYAGVRVILDSTSYLCGLIGSGEECVRQHCIVDSCQTEWCEAAGGRWCSNDSTVECDVASDCGAAYCGGHCSKMWTQACNPDPAVCPGMLPDCPTGQVCKGGASCMSHDDKVVIATPLNAGVPASVRTVLWTLNDELTGRRGRNGVKLVWNRNWQSVPPLGYRVYRATHPDGPYCALLDPPDLNETTTPPLPPGIGRCTSDFTGWSVDMDAFSENYSSSDNNDAASNYMQTYWDQSAGSGRVYYYRVTQIDSEVGGGAIESAMSEIAAGQVLSYDQAVPPPPQGLRAWAPHSGTQVDWHSVHLKWCTAPTPSATSADAQSFPVPTEYRIYRRRLLPEYRYQLIARFAASCLDAGKRCEVTAANDCSNNDPGTCSVLGPLAVACGATGQPLCGIVDHTFGCWPLKQAVSQPDFNYSYFVTAVAGASPGIESMPSNFNEAWLNYCVGITGSNCDPTQTCEGRRDPDGDGEFSVCGNENASLSTEPPEGHPNGDVSSREADVTLASCDAPLSGPPFEPLLAPYRVVGQTPPPNPPYRFVFYHLDHLGTPRLILDESGNTVSQHHYLPFGEERPAPANPDPTLNRRAFTGHERDAESGLDYMLARYYSSSLGRFMAVDPGDDTDLEDPQSWNRYAYVRNRPVIANDPDGKVLNMLAGAAIGAGMDILVQMTVGGKSFSEVDMKSVAISAAAGAIGVGIAAKVATLGKTAAALADVAVDTGASVAGQLADDGQISLGDTILDVGLSQGAGLLAGASPEASRLRGQADTKAQTAKTNRREGHPDNAARREAQAGALNAEAAELDAARGVAVGTAASNAGSAIKENVKQKIEKKE